MDTFKKEQNTPDSEPLKLIQDMPTRWNSTYLMIKRVLEVNEALGKALLKLRRAPPPLSIEEATLKVSGKLPSSGIYTIKLIANHFR